MRRRGLALTGFAVVAAVFPVLGAFAQDPKDPDISVSPSSRQFGSRCVGTTSTPQSFTISNTADPDMGETLDVASITRSGSSQFTFTNPAPVSVPAGGDTSFAVTFSPIVRGTRSADFTISSDDPDESSVEVSVSGTGIDRRLSADRSTVSFGEQRVGTRSPSQTLLLRNPGGDPVTVSTVRRLGAHGADFIVTYPSLPFVISAGNVRTVTVAFQPRAAGLRNNASVEFGSNACVSPRLRVSLVGTGIVPDVAVEPNPIDAGASPRGTQGSATPVTITNRGGAALTITVVQVIGTDAADFTLSGLPVMPTTVLPGDSFVFTLRATPSAEGPRSATLNVLSDDPDSPEFAVPMIATGGTASPSPSPSPTRTASPTPSPSSPSPSPRALGPSATNDSLALWLVIGGVVAAFAALIVIRRAMVAGRPEE